MLNNREADTMYGDVLDFVALCLIPIDVETLVFEGKDANEHLVHALNELNNGAKEWFRRLHAHDEEDSDSDSSDDGV